MKAWFFILMAAAGAWGMERAEAGMEADVPLDSDAQARIVVTSCFDNLALAGYAPVDVTINNHSGQTRQWVLNFSSPGYVYGSENAVKSSFTVTAEDNGTRTTTLLVPTMLTANGQAPLMLNVTGYGATSVNEEMMGARTFHGGGPQTAFVAISESLGTTVWSSLQARVSSDGTELMGSTVNPDGLPEDWRGLSGVGGLWLSGDELNRLSPEQRQAVAMWVHAGGWLMLCGVTQAPADFQRAGFGEVRLLPATLDVDGTARLIGIVPRPGSKTEFKTGKDPRYTALAEVKPNVPLLGTFIGLFAILVGPVNVFGLARKRRERLFWTTPLMSLCASGLLMGMIVAQDGTGGYGYRKAVVCLFPESHMEVVRQEQISRTGVLMGTAFQTRDPAVMEQQRVVTPDDQSNVVYPYNEGQGRVLWNVGTSFGKDWFETRAVQAQRIVAVMPTRAEITVLNAADVKNSGAAPVIVSSFGATLDTFYYHDENHRAWEGKNVRTGEKQTLQPADAAATGLPSSPAVVQEANESGYFQATASGGEDYVQTLGAIRWTDEPVIYVGPVTE